MFTIFNFKGGGHIAISNDDLAEPVLGYGLTSYINPETVNPGLELLYELYKKEIKSLKKGKFSENEKIKRKWDALLTETASSELKSYSIGGRLVNTLWFQSAPYNDSCPIDPSSNEPCVIGCNGLALGMVLNYWGDKGEDIFPDSTVSHSCWTLGSNNTFTVNFYDQNYSWYNIGNYMPYTAQFLSHCALATKPCPFTSEQTGSNIGNVKKALEYYFSFETDGVQEKSTYSDAQWENLLKDEIDDERPVIYEAHSTVGFGHTWIIDGYDAYDYFHCNWGWGNSDGENDFYSLTSLEPTVDTTTFYYDIDFKAITGIKPILGSDFGISGPSIVCSSNSTFEVSVPVTARIEWGKTANLNEVGDNTDPTYTVNAASSGQGGVNVTIKNSQGQTLVTDGEYLWVGTPVIIGLDGPTYVPSDVDTRYYPLYGYQIASPTNFMWMVNPQDGVSYDSYGWSTLVNFDYPGYYSIIYRGLNTCGWGDWSSSFNIQVYSSRSLSVSPNPTSGETIIAIETPDKKATSTTETEEMAFDETAEWELEIFDNVQNLIAKKTKLKGKEYRINTSGWIDGVYMIRVKYKDEVITGKLVVKG